MHEFLMYWTIQTWMPKAIVYFLYSEINMNIKKSILRDLALCYSNMLIYHSLWLLRNDVGAITRDQGVFMTKAY